MNNNRIITIRAIWITLGILLILAIPFLVISLIYRNDTNSTCGCSSTTTTTTSPTSSSNDCDVVVGETLTITTDYGKVRGRKECTLFGRKTFFAFKGIPYAQPPIGQLRFKPPKESNSWTHVHDAFEYGNMCVQTEGRGDENCLFINIFVPSGIQITETEKPLPVLLAIHGGGYYEGSGADSGPDFLIDQDNVIIVTFNYRVGALGFMSLKTPEYSGNMGLKDQSLAINWTYKNIHHFGGDPNQITLHGLSAGSASVEFHILQKNHLFKRAIMSSGSALNPWAISFTDHTPILYRLAQKYDYQSNNLTELIDNLLKIDAKNFVNIETTNDDINYSSGRLSMDLIWVPVVEVENAIEPFLIDLPANIYRSADFKLNIDLFIGTVADESLYMLDSVLKNPEILQPFNTNFELDLPLNELNKNLNFTSAKYQQIANDIRWHYFQHSGGQVNNNSVYDYGRLLSDVMINYGVDRSAKIISTISTGQTYYYIFSVNAAFNVIKLSTYAHTIGMGGATHGDDRPYVLGKRTPDGKSDEMYHSVDENSLERQRINDFTRIYCNFIKHGIPMVDIDSEVKIYPISATETNFLNITNDGPKIERDARYNDVQFWNIILEI